jgi:hypothetical protein
MGRELALTLSLSLLAVISCSCAPAPEEVAESAEAITDVNAMNLNAMNLNAMNLNAMNLNALTSAALDPAALLQLQDSSSTGDLARQLLRYTVGCAFDTTQTFAFTWFDSAGAQHDEVYTGVLGLAPEWSTAPIGPGSQRFVSACLISRVNYYGVPVMLSSRGPLGILKKVPAAEIAAYTVLEGGFWGNLFGSAPVAYACDYPDNDALSRSRSRVCAAGWIDGTGAVQGCGMIQRVGACSAACASLKTQAAYYPQCTGLDGDSNSQVVTVYLAP